MTVAWTYKAEKDRDNIADYICENFGAKRMKRFKQELDQVAEMIERYPNIGPIDPFFADRSKAYRSVIVGGLSKMVYFVEGETIYIAALWDCRKDPEEQAGKVE